MKAVYLGYNPPGSTEREPRWGLTIGKTYDIKLLPGSAYVIDDDGDARFRPLQDFDLQTDVRRAWASFHSLRGLFA